MIAAVMSRLPALAMARCSLVACQTVPSPPSLQPLEEPRALEAAPPRVNGAIPSRPQPRARLQARGVAAKHRRSHRRRPGARGQAGEVTLNFVDTDIREIARTILGTTLKLNYTIDPNVHGTGSIETGTPLPRSALLPTLETLLNQTAQRWSRGTGFTPSCRSPWAAASNQVSGANAIGAGTQVVPLRYASAKDLAKVLEPYVAEGGKISADLGRNASWCQRRCRRSARLWSAWSAPSTSIFSPANPTPSSRRATATPAKLASELEKVLQAQGEGPLGGLVRVLPMERVNAVLVVSSQPRYIDAAKRFAGLMNRVEDATARTWHVYYVQNGQSADLEILLQRAFTPRNVSPTGAPPGGTAPGAEQLTIGGGQPSGRRHDGFRWSRLHGRPRRRRRGSRRHNRPGRRRGGRRSRRRAGGGDSSSRRPPPRPRRPPPSRCRPRPAPGRRGAENRIRIIANRRNNALLIYATPSEYAVIEGMLRKIDIIPLQVLIEATIAEVDLNDTLQYGTQFFFKARPRRQHAGPVRRFHPAFPTLGQLTFPSTLPYFILSKSPNFALAALSTVTKVKVLSAPQVMVLDNEPARLQVGQQVPVLTGTATSTLAAGAPVVNSVDYHSTGVIMQVTPRVNSGGLVTLDIAQEVSDVAAPATNTVQGSPTFNDQTFRTRVAVQDGQTVGMAGLIRDNASEGNSGIPLLKDIPILGTLFSTQSNSRTRTELLVLITPHVVHDQRDARALTEDLRSQLINAGLVPQQLQRKGIPGLANPNGL